MKAQSDFLAQEESTKKTITSPDGRFSPLNSRNSSYLPPITHMLTDTILGGGQDTSKLRAKDFVSFQPLPLSTLLADQPTEAGNSNGSKSRERLRRQRTGQLSKMVTGK